MTNLTGIEQRDTASGVHVLRLHYTADPDKGSLDWRGLARQGYPSEREWKREMEIDWTVAIGLPVYAEEFVRDWHVAKEPLRADITRPIFRGWDFGLCPSCIWLQLDAAGRVNVLSEMVVWDGRGDMTQSGIERFCPAAVLQGNQWYPGGEFRDYADPAGWSKSQTDEKTCVQIMADSRVYPTPGPVTWTERKRAVVELLGRGIGGRAALMISPECRMLLEGFSGAYRFEEVGETGRYKETVEKNAWSHPMNALEYVLGSLFVKSGRRDFDDDERRERKAKPKGRSRWTGY